MTTSSCVKSYLVLFSLLIFSGIFLAFGLALGIFYSGPNVFVGDFVNFISNPDGSHTFDLSTTEPAVPPTKVIDAEGKTRFILKAEPKVILRNRGKLGLTFHPHVVLPFYIPAQHASSCILGESSVPYGRLNLEEKSVERCLSPSNQSSQPSLDNFDNLLQYTLLNPPLNKSGMATDVTGERPSTLQSRAGIQNILTSQFKGLFQGTDDIGSHPVRYWIFGTVQNENPQATLEQTGVPASSLVESVVHVNINTVVADGIDFLSQVDLDCRTFGLLRGGVLFYQPYSTMINELIKVKFSHNVVMETRFAIKCDKVIDG